MTVTENIVIAPYTSMKVGGVVKKLCRPESKAELLQAITKAGDGKLLVVGNASNLLFPDEGYDGTVILTGNVKGIALCGNVITAECGVSLSNLSRFARDHGKGGLVFGYGIPGTVGGGVFMNAGAYGGEIADTLASVTCCGRSGKCYTLQKEDLCFAHRHSVFMEKELFVLSADFVCPDADPETLTAEMEHNMEQRKAKQPLEYPSCGSVFKRPVGYFAGGLIEQAGLKGKTVGGAQVSEKHAGFIINTGNATAADIKQLIGEIQTIVFDRFGVRLEPEVQII